MRREPAHAGLHQRQEGAEGRYQAQGRARIEAREVGTGAFAWNEAHRAHRGARQQPDDIGADMGEGEDQLGRARAQPHRLARPQLVEGHGLDRFTRPQPRLDRPRIVARGRRKQSGQSQTERAAAASGRGEQAGVEQALQLQRRHTHAPSLGDQAIDAIAHRPQSVRSLARIDRRHAGAGTSPALEQARGLQLLVDLAHGHRRQTEQGGKLAHRRQAAAGRELAAGDAVLDQSAKLDAERYRQVTVDAQVHPVPIKVVSTD